MVKHQLKMIKSFTLLKSITAYLEISSFIIIMIILCTCITKFLMANLIMFYIYANSSIKYVCMLHDHYTKTEKITIQVICKLFHYHIT